MEISFNMPALLFPAISLLMLAYGNRFVALAGLVRKLHAEYKNGDHSEIVVRQIVSLRRRINYIRYMQGLGVLSFLCCVVCMYCIYQTWNSAAKYVFATALLSLGASLVVSLFEIIVSTNALELELSDVEEAKGITILNDPWNKPSGT